MRRATVFAAAAALSTFFFVLAGHSSPASAQERVPAPGGIYSGRLTDTTGECSRGSLTLGEEFSLVMAEYGATIRSIRVTGLTFLPLITSPTSFEVSAGIAVAADGSFNQDFTPYGLAQVHIEGRFEGTSVSGSLRVSVGATVECEGTFQGELTPQVGQESTFEATVDVVDGCGGGSISITRAPDLLSITSLSVDGFRADGHTFSGSATFDEGTVPISPDNGSFGWVYFPGREAGQEIAVNGSFFGNQVRGLVTVAPSSCGPVRFAPLEGRGGPGLPATGGGPAADSRPGSQMWIAPLSLGVIALAVGLGLMRRRVRRR